MLRIIKLSVVGEERPDQSRSSRRPLAADRQQYTGSMSQTSSTNRDEFMSVRRLILDIRKPAGLIWIKSTRCLAVSIAAERQTAMRRMLFSEDSPSERAVQHAGLFNFIRETQS